ncbi:MAG: alanine/ornithine racemase family PLP-dependent enzyme [Bacillota bacterium]
MNEYPCTNIYLDKIKENAAQMKTKCAQHGAKLAGVTKGAAGDIRVAQAFLDAGVEQLADSRLENLKKFKEAGLKAEMMMLRLPYPEEAEAIVEYADISLNSELTTLQALSQAARRKNLIHKVIIMVDVGDLREGVMPEDLHDFMAEAMEYQGIDLLGIGTNVGCYGGVLPTPTNTRALVEMRDRLETRLNCRLPVISGGNTATTILLDQDKLPAGINHFRVGEGIIQGTDVTHQRNLIGFNQQNITLTAPIIELKEKPSVPSGEIGHDAFGQKPHFEDKGIRLRAILKVGRQDVRPDNISPTLAGIDVIGASSDHLILDVTEVDKKLSVGDLLTFELGYGAMLTAMTSIYLARNYRMAHPE